jgi:choline-sulfatase
MLSTEFGQERQGVSMTNDEIRTRPTYVFPTSFLITSFVVRHSCLVVLSSLGFFSAVSLAAERPNIVFLYTDDQAPRAVRAAGDQQFITPHLDRIFQEGAHLTNSFTTTPVCSPSRAGLLTSRYGSELGITDWINPRREPELGLDPQSITWPQLLARAGYHNGLIGMWSLGMNERSRPTRFGYHEFWGIRTAGGPVENPAVERTDGKIEQISGFTTEIFTDYALQFIRDNQHQPFLLSLNYRAPHEPWLPVRPEDWEPFENLDPVIPNPDYPKLDVELIKKKTREYLASVKSIDRNVGRLLDLLDELQLSASTIVIFTSDHGYNLGEHGIWYKGNAIRALTENPPQKWKNIPPDRRPNLWDTSLRVPTAVRWPGVIKPGSNVTQTVSNLDWFPTLLAMAGVDLPPELTIRGRDITPLLRDESVEWDNDLYVEYSMHHGATTHMRGYRTPRWKLVRDFANDRRAELYDLVNDPHETTNLIESADPHHVQMMKQLHEKIIQKMKSLDDPVYRTVTSAPQSGP